MLLNVELKAGLGFETLNERLIDILIQYGIEEHTIVSSFNHYALAHLKQLRPEIRTGILYNAALVNPWVYAQSIGASALHPYYLSNPRNSSRGAAQRDDGQHLDCERTGGHPENDCRPSGQHHYR